ncbi:MAG: hypothetical protein WDZ69_03295 [Candidatus Pacearchaeota archaeon]
MIDFILEIDWLLFFHFAGIIIGLGAVTVIDLMGFISRKDKKWTRTTIQAHHVTKPLIWIGSLLLIATFVFIFPREGITTLNLAKSGLLVIMALNGSFLSFYVSPRLDKLAGKNVLLHSSLQNKIATSMIISFLSWWIFVLLSVSGLRI